MLMKISKRHFRKIIDSYYRIHRRSFPWRRTKDPYRILVSEIMLQQTQAERVVPKYNLFLKRFPSVRTLARASLKDVLTLWQGLGYNRRALSLKKLAETVLEEYSGNIPVERDKLQNLPGIGPYTASAIRTFAWNFPEVFIETNIRSVFIHFFFAGKNNIKDDQIIPRIKETLDRKNPRRWYSALMDYGAYLKTTKPNPSRKSRHYIRQTPFNNSSRELRGKIIAALLKEGNASVSELSARLSLPASRILMQLRSLKRDGLIAEESGRCRIS